MIGPRGRCRVLTGAMSGLMLFCVTSPSYSNSCHKFSIWRYPWPQTCGTKHLAYQANVSFPLPPERDADMALPDLPLIWLNTSEPDDETRGKLMLLGVLRKP